MSYMTIVNLLLLKIIYIGHAMWMNLLYFIFLFFFSQNTLDPSSVFFFLCDNQQ